MKAPDYTQPFIGWKGLVARERHLFSPARRVEWPSGQPLVAVCDLRASHVPPHPRCSCGVYATDSFESLKSNGYNWSDHDDDEQWVIVEVSLWGELRRGQIGYRATKAYPKTIYVPPYLWAVGDAVRRRYHVPMHFIDRFTGERIT